MSMIALLMIASQANSRTGLLIGPCGCFGSSLEPVVPIRYIATRSWLMHVMNRSLRSWVLLALTGPFLTKGSFAGLANEGVSGLYVRSIPQVLALPDEQIDLASAALIVSERWSDIVEGLRYRQRIDSMAYHIQQVLRDQGIGLDYRALDVINQYLFNQMGFHAVPHARDANDLFIHSVLDRRRGYCLSLSILYLSIGERLGLPLFGVVVPGHFFVRYDDGRVRINIETTDNGSRPSDDYYRSVNRVPVAHPLYLQNLTKSQTLACLFNNLGVVYMDTNYLDLAVEALELGVRIVPNLAEIRANLANAYFRQGLVENALLHYGYACNLNPNDAKIRQAMGSLYLANNQPDLATMHLSHAIELDPNLTDAYIQLAAAYMKKGQFTVATDVLQMGLARNSRSAEIYAQFGQVYYQQGQYQQAVEMYEKALAMQPSSVTANFGLGLCYNKLDKPDLAIACYKRVLSLDAKNAPAMMNLGSCFLAKKEFQTALGYYLQAARIDPDDPWVYYQIGGVYAQQSQWRQAGDYFRHALARKPDLGEAHHGLAVSLYNLGDYKQAWDHLVLARQFGVQVPEDLERLIKSHLAGTR